MSDLVQLNATHWRILDAMRQHGSVTVRSFSHTPTIDGGEDFDRLPARIIELRAHGYNIETVMETSRRGKRFGRFVLRGEADVSGAASTPSSPQGADRESTEAAPETSALFDLAGTPYDVWEAA